RFEVLLLGRFEQANVRLFDRQRHIPFLDFNSYRSFMRQHAGAIALAPLPSRLPIQAQRFFDAKSDIKLLDFLSAGMIPVCSTALPYTTSELFIPQLASETGDGLIEIVRTIASDTNSAMGLVNTLSSREKLLHKRTFVELSKVLDD